MHKADPLRRYYRFFFIMEGIVIGLLFLQALFSTLAGQTNYFLYSDCAFLLLLLILVFFTFKRRHQRTEQRRQHAFSGDPAFLAQPQPVPDPHALPLPSKIILRLSILHLLEFWIIAYIFMALISFIFLFLASPQEMGHNPTIFAVLLGVLFFPLLVGLLITLLMRNFYRQEVTVDEQGIMTKYFGKVTHIAWNEVKSFAMWGNVKRYSIVQFEVTSDDGIARWYELSSKRSFLSWLSMLKPDLPYEQYQDASVRLQKVIVARSGKPLYDLRDTKLIEW